MLGGQPGRRTRLHGEAPGEAGVVDEPGRTGLDQALDHGGLLGTEHHLGVVGDRETRGVLGQAPRLILGQDRVGEEGTGRPGVVVGSVQNHPLGAAQLENRLAQLALGHAFAQLDTERTGQLGVGDARGQGALPHGEGGVENHPAPSRPPQAPTADLGVGEGLLEAGVAIRQPQLAQGQPHHPVAQTVPGAHAGDELGDLGAVGPDVLHRGGTDRTGDPGQGREPGPLAGDGLTHQVVPGGTGGGRDLDTAAHRVGDE